jgi:hypothetical protein
MPNNIDRTARKMQKIREVGAYRATGAVDAVDTYERGR